MRARNPRGAKRELSAAKVVEILQKCGSTSRVLASGENAVFHWAEDAEDLFSPFLAEMERYLNVARELPAEWHRRTSNQYVAGRVYGSRRVLLRCMDAISQSLDHQARALFQSFIVSPWRYSAFSVDEKLADTLFRIRDYCTGATLLLQSASLERLHKRGVPLFFTLLFDNGVCFQTYGPLHYFLGFQPYDFVSLSRMIQPRVFAKGGLDATIERDPVPFLLLSRWSEIPPVAHQGSPVEICFHSASGGSFDSVSFAGAHGFSLARKGGVFRLSLLEKERPFDFARIYHSPRKGEIAVSVSGMSHYAAARRLLSPNIRLPRFPDWRTTANMGAVASLLVGKDLPGERMEKLFDIREKPGHKDELKALNALVAEMTDCSNRGLPFDLVEAAERFGVPLDDAREMQKQLERIAQRFDIQLEGGLPGFSPPPPITRLKIKTSLEDCPLFRFDTGGRALELFEEQASRLKGLARSVGKETPSPEELPGILEELGLRFWKTTGPLILNYTLFMLARAGAVPRPVDEYATEILRIFWQVLITNRGKKQIARFIDRYEMFCEEILAPAGLVVVSGPSGESEDGGASASSVSTPLQLLMERSDFFNAWVSLVDR